MTVIVRNGHFKSIIVPQTLDSQTQKKNKNKKNKQENDETNDCFLFHGQGSARNNEKNC